MIRWIECLRLAAARGLKCLPSVAGILRGTNHFWKFGDWVEYEQGLGTRPAFYFMARRGSLLKFAMGTPDAFYNIGSPRFKDLFRQLTRAVKSVCTPPIMHTASPDRLRVRSRFWKRCRERL